jgi:hypothetical protein
MRMPYSGEFGGTRAMIRPPDGKVNHRKAKKFLSLEKQDGIGVEASRIWGLVGFDILTGGSGGEPLRGPLLGCESAFLILVLGPSHGGVDS